MTPVAASIWLTAAEIAQSGLPGLPDCKRRVNHLAAAEGWAQRTALDGTPLARPRKARGGGIEYHASLLSEEAQAMLSARALSAEAAPTPANDTGSAVADRWAWYNRQPLSTQTKAMMRVSILAEVEELTLSGVTKTQAISIVSDNHSVSVSAIGRWFTAVVGVDRCDRLPFLAPQYKSVGKKAEIDPLAWKMIRADYLRPEKPSFAACYRRLSEYAKPKGIPLPNAKTLQRRLEREVSPSFKTAKREGREALRRSVPPQRRTVADLHAMQAVNVDGHTFDVFVEWEDGRIGRPVMVGLQDVFSRKLLAHRIGETESTLLTRMAFADLFRDYGIPPEAVMDNGRAFASKALTGGALTRFRFKIKDTDATGVLTALGVRVHWTLPYRGSSKPIERAWRDLCEDVAKHPAVAGAYTGNKPDAKPENYRERAIPIAEFREHVARQIAAHNAREGRRTEMAKGSSFDDVFAKSYAISPIGRARPDQLLQALLVAEDRRCDKRSGAVTLAGNTYWSPALSDLAGELVTVRFDPDNLHGEVHVYSRNGEYFGPAPVIAATGFFDKAGAERRSKLEADVRRKVRAAEDAADMLRVDQLAELLAEPATPAPLPEAGVVRPVRHRGQTAAALKPIQQAVAEPAAPSFIDAFTAGTARLRVVE
ncbi:transposase domain-containing protein [Sphingomonas oryzagri]